MTFAQALVRIEEILNDEYDTSIETEEELNELVSDHLETMVQLGKVAAEMRAVLIDNRQWARMEAAQAYDALMEGEE